MYLRSAILSCVLTLLSGCAASWQAIDVYAPYDATQLADSPVAVVRPVVTSRPDPIDSPWGRQADRFHAALLAELDGPFVASAPVAPGDLGWSEESWARLDDVVGALLGHAANPFPRGDHRIEEGTPAVFGDPVGRDGLVLLTAVQPSMRETLARLSGVAGEVTRNSGFVDHIGSWGQYDQFGGAREAAGAPPPRHEVTELQPDVGTLASPGEPSGTADREQAARRERDTMIGKQNRVDVALLLVDRRSGRFVAAASVRLEPVSGPQGSYAGAIRKALRDWRLAGQPWTAELFQP